MTEQNSSKQRMAKHARNSLGGIIQILHTQGLSLTEIETELHLEPTHGETARKLILGQHYKSHKQP